jgi:hypothetical protein
MAPDEGLGAGGPPAAGGAGAGESASLTAPDGSGGAGFAPPGAPPGARAGARGGQQQLPRFKLTNAAAKPQNNNAAVNFSIEYALEGGQLARGVKIVWVIQPSKGKEVEKPVSLRTKGRQRWFNKDVPADRGPFKCYFALVMNDGKKLPISDTVSMK